MICCIAGRLSNFHSETNLKLHVPSTGQIKDKMFYEWPLHCRIINQWFILILWTPGFSRKYAIKQTVSEKMIRVFSGKHLNLMCQKKNILGSRVSKDTVTIITNMTNFIVATLMTTVWVFKKICCLIFELGSWLEQYL